MIYAALFLGLMGFVLGVAAFSRVNKFEKVLRQSGFLRFLSRLTNKTYL